MPPAPCNLSVARQRSGILIKPASALPVAPPGPAQASGSPTTTTSLIQKAKIQSPANPPDSTAPPSSGRRPLWTRNRWWSGLLTVNTEVMLSGRKTSPSSSLSAKASCRGLPSIHRMHLSLPTTHPFTRFSTPLQALVKNRRTQPILLTSASSFSSTAKKTDWNASSSTPELRT